MKRWISVVVAIVALLLGGAFIGNPSAAFAAPPRAKTVLKKAAAAAPSWATLRASWVDTPAEGPPRVGLRLLIIRGVGARLDRIRLDAPSGEPAVETVFWRVSIGGSIPSDGIAAWADAPVWIRWVAGDAPSLLLKALGADAKRVSLGHAGPNILWVVGAGPQERERPQVAIERESGRLRRVVSIQSPGLDPKGTTLALVFGPTPKDAVMPPTLTWTEAGATTVYALQTLSVDTLARAWSGLGAQMAP